MANESLLEVIQMLVGYSEPYGAPKIDDIRYKNQEKIILILTNGIEDLINNSKYRNNPKDSVSKIGNRAYEVLCQLRKEIDKCL